MENQPTHPQQPPQQPQPVAYDVDGRPLYHAPPQQAVPPVQPQQPIGQSIAPQPLQQPPIQQPPQATPQVVHLSRAVDPIEQVISPEVKARHGQSVRDFPQLNLSEAEFVINMVQRHPIGLFAPIAITIFIVAFVVSVMVNYDIIMSSLFGSGMYTENAGSVYLVGGLIVLLVSVLCYINVWVYTNNKFFLTNESVIQEIQVSLFSRHEQTVSLQNIEDASYRQQGILQTMFNYGSIRLSTEGDETTYRFNYVTDPKQQIAILNDAVEAFKNGRPVTND